MEEMRILLLGFVLSSFNECVSGKYELICAQHIIDISHDEKVSYFDEHTVANTDKFPVEEERKKKCRAGFDLVREYDSGNRVQFREDGETEKLKLYLLKDTVSENVIELMEIVSAFACPTDPPAFLYINIILGEGYQQFNHRVIFRRSHSFPLPMKFANHQMKLVQQIHEATVEEISATLSRDIKIPKHNLDELSEGQRLELCAKATEIIPELNIQTLNDAATGKAKLYKLAAEFDEPTGGYIVGQIIMLAFSCPSQPKMYIYVNDNAEKLYDFLAIVAEGETKFRPPFGILGYNIVDVEAIDVYTETDDDKSEKLDEGKGYRKPKIRESALDTDEKFTELERRDICGRAMKLVSDRDVAFTGDVSGRSQYYVVHPLYEPAILVLEAGVVQAFECATVPVLYLHIMELWTNEYMVYVFVDPEKCRR